MQNNYLSIIRILFDLLGLEYTKYSLKESLYTNPNFPSLLSVSEVLEKYNIDCIAVEVDSKRLKEMPVPFIAECKDGELVVVQSVDDIVKLKNESRRQESIPFKDFLKLWSGVLLVPEKNKKSTEPNYNENRYKDKFLSLVKIILIAFLISLFITIVTKNINNDPNIAISVIVLLAIKIIGLGIGILLVREEMGSSSKILNAVCSTNNTFDCKTVLNSKYTKFFRGEVSVNALVCSYFLSTLSVFLIFLGSQDILYFLSFFGLITIPIVLVSLFYQFVTLKKICKICLIIQALLIVEFAICFKSDILQTNYSHLDVIVPSFLFIFVTGILGYKWSKSFSSLRQERYLLRRDLARFKLDKNVFGTILLKSKKINIPSKNLGISFVNKNSKINVLKICNPYCNPCADSHPILEDLYRKNLINLQIIYVSTLQDEDIRQYPVKHFLAIHKFKDEETSMSVLSDWYLSEEKAYESLCRKYPLNGELNGHDKHVEEMLNWCNTQGIVHTPSVFIDGYELPSQYSLKDFKALILENYC